MYNEEYYIDQLNKLNAVMMLRGEDSFGFPTKEDYVTLWWTKYTSMFGESGYLLYLINIITKFTDIEVMEIKLDTGLIRCIYVGPLQEYHVSCHIRFEMSFDDLIKFLSTHKRKKWRSNVYPEVVMKNCEEKALLSQMYSL